WETSSPRISSHRKRFRRPGDERVIGAPAAQDKCVLTTSFSEGRPGVWRTMLRRPSVSVCQLGQDLEGSRCLMRTGRKVIQKPGEVGWTIDGVPSTQNLDAGCGGTETLNRLLEH